MNPANGLYGRLEERILDRDSVGASDVYYRLCREGRPLAELLREATRIHAPYTHVPHHERIDDGYVNFVNNDHCLLSARATHHLSDMVSPEIAGLPMAQTVWYIPTGLDIWNQKINRAPGHYARGFKRGEGPPPAPQIHWPDREPEPVAGDYEDALAEWTTRVHRGQVPEAYGLFLGLMADERNRERALAQLAFAGLIDLQDRVFLNRSYTTGHKAYRARATVELGERVGWDSARPILYAGALDIAVGPRWYSTYEYAGNAVKTMIDGETLRAVPYAGASDAEGALSRNTGALSARETEDTITAIVREPEPANTERIAELLRAGKSPTAIIDAVQLAAAQILLETRDALNFSIPQHCYEYCNTVRWFLDRFDHKQRVRMLFTAASFVARNAEHQRCSGDSTPFETAPPGAAAAMPLHAKLAELERAQLATDLDASHAWLQACLEDTRDRAPIVRTLADAAAKVGNDPHNQEIALCFLEDFGRSGAAERDRLLHGAAHHTAGHRKYGDFLECYRRFAAAMDPDAAA